jgi:hypothetical protein
MRDIRNGNYLLASLRFVFLSLHAQADLLYCTCNTVQTTVRAFILCLRYVRLYEYVVPLLIDAHVVNQNGGKLPRRSILFVAVWFKY